MPPIPEVDIYKLSWVIIRALLLILNGAVMIYCYCKIYSKMMERMKSRGVRKRSVRKLRNAVEAEDTTAPETTTAGESKTSATSESKVKTNGSSPISKSTRTNLSAD